MKHILHKHLCPRGTTAMLSALLLLAAASAAYAGQVTVTRTYDTSAITLGTETAPDGTRFQSIGWPGLDCTAETGAPQLPVEYIRLMVPVYSNNFRVTLQSATGAYQLPLQSKVIAGQIPQISDGSPAPEFTYPDGAAYTAAGANARVVSHGYIDGCNHLVTVAVCPVAYDGGTGATAYGSVTVRLDYDECTEAGLEGSRPLFPPHASPYVDVAGMVANTPDVARFRAARLPDATKGKYADWYYIIVPENLEHAVGDLALWKRQKGYNVVVKTIESITATPKYAVNSSVEIVDSAASLRAYLKDEFKSHGAFFCLLVGNDRTSMPIRKAYDVKKDSLYKYFNNEVHAVPTDSYFSDLTELWNLEQHFINPIYTAEINRNYSPDIYIGRILCSTPEEFANYFAKLPIYEANPGYGDASYLGRAFFFEASNGMINNSSEIRNTLPTGLNIDLLVDDRKGFPSGKSVIDHMRLAGFNSWHGHGSAYDVTCAAQYSEVINCDTINYRSHVITSMDFITGSPWVGEGVHIDNFCHDEKENGLDKLDNRKYPSITYSMSCKNAPFDRLRWVGVRNDLHLTWDYDSTYNLAEAYTVVGKFGGIAFLGNTRDGYTHYSPKLEREFVNIIKTLPKIGIAEAVSKLSYRDSYLSCTHNLVGEPELEMWLGVPKQMDWKGLKAYSTEWFSQPQADGSTWTISDGEDNWFKVRCSSGKIPVVNSSLLAKDHLISVWKPGYLPLLHYNGINGTLTNKSKRFIVRSASLGHSYAGEKPLGKFIVSDNTNLSIEALDSISSSDDFEIEANGKVALKCDRDIRLDGAAIRDGGNLTVTSERARLGKTFSVATDGSIKVNCNHEAELTGSTVRKGGKMTVEAQKVTLGPGFKVEAGGTLQITTKE